MVEKKKEELTEYEKLQNEFHSDARKIRERLTQLENNIPKLEQEKQQLIGMLNVIQNVLNRSEETNDDGDDN